MSKEYPDIRELAEACLAKKWNKENTNEVKSDCAFCETFKLDDDYDCFKCIEIYPDVNVICAYISRKTDYAMSVEALSINSPDQYELIIHALSELKETGKLTPETKAQLEK